jgi:hypothetical protein
MNRTVSPCLCFSYRRILQPHEFAESTAPTKKLLGASGGQESSVHSEIAQTVQANSIAFELSTRY